MSYDWPPPGNTYSGLPYWPTLAPRELSPSTPFQEQIASVIQAAKEVTPDLPQTELSEPQTELETTAPQMVTCEVTVYDENFNPSFPLDPALRFGDLCRMRQEDYLPPVRWQETMTVPAPRAPQPVVFRHMAQHAAREYASPYPPVRVPTSTVTTTATPAYAGVATTWAHTPARPVFADPPATTIPVSAVNPLTSVSGASGTRISCPVRGCTRSYTTSGSVRAHVRLHHPEHAHLVATNRSRKRGFLNPRS